MGRGGEGGAGKLFSGAKTVESLDRTTPKLRLVRTVRERVFFCFEKGGGVEADTLQRGPEYQGHH